MIEKALAVDLDEPKHKRLPNELARRNADWLLERIDELFLNPNGDKEAL
jgi:hypothetical protein